MEAWEDPRHLGDWLSHPLLNRDLRPPMERGIYIVTEKSWTGSPHADSGVIYIGKAGSLRDRTGRLVAEILGFTTETLGWDGSYYHSGGHRIWTDYCLLDNVEPLTLYLGWLVGCECLNCAESQLIRRYDPRCNANGGSICRMHVPPLSLEQNSSATAAL
jgi:hypothetical protein